MKFLFILTLLCVLPFGAKSQTDFNQWSLGLSIGGHDGMFPSKSKTKLYQIHHYGIDARYMVNNRFGIMLDMGYDFLNFKNAGIKSNYFRTSIQGVVNAGDILRFDTWTSRVGLLIHGGFGVSHLWQAKELQPADPQDRLIKGVDEMINYTFGVTPQFKVTERVSLNADLAFTFHQGQSNHWDWNNAGNRGSIDGYFLNVSVGASFYLGKHKDHADWTPTVYGGNDDLSKYDAYEARIAELERRLTDTDKDGVVDDKDEEPNTKEGAIVDSKGKAILDSDNDGVPDAVDACPMKAGSFSTDGCPDSDNDGVIDSKDKCPTIPGVIENSGCPAIDKEVEEVMNKALEGVHFQTGKDVLTSNSYPVLDQVVEVMNSHDDYFLEISGHTDNVGGSESNLELSESRVQSVVKYLKEKGLSEERIHAHGFGETKPKASNDTDKGRALNRRVEFNVVFE